jgi:hypothetical protein
MSKRRAKKNRTRAENWAIRNRVQLYIQQGYPVEQAQAIAFRQFRDGELEIPKTEQDRETIKEHDAFRLARQASAIYTIYQLARKAFDTKQEIEQPKKQE